MCPLRSLFLHATFLLESGAVRSKTSYLVFYFDGYHPQRGFPAPEEFVSVQRVAAAATTRSPWHSDKTPHIIKIKAPLALMLILGHSKDVEGDFYQDDEDDEQGTYDGRDSNYSSHTGLTRFQGSSYFKQDRPCLCGTEETYPC